MNRTARTARTARTTRATRLLAAIASPLAALLATGLAATPAAAQNLIVNGDFESGDTGFSSGYDVADLLTTGTYCVATDPVECSPLGADFHDHTSGSGNMMVLNGAKGYRVTAWTQVVDVKPSTVYLFSGWVASWGRNSNGHRDPSPAVARVGVGSTMVGRIHPPAHDGVWRRFEFPWLSGSSQTSTRLAIFDANRDEEGNDFALDDLSFAPASDQ